MHLWIDPDKCSEYARKIAEENLADGVKLTTNNHNVIRVDAVTNIPQDNVGMATVTVTIEMMLKDIVSPIFGRIIDHVTVESCAGAAGSVTRPNANVLFPLAVSIDSVSGDNGTGKGNNLSNDNGGSKNNVGSGVSLLQAMQGNNNPRMFDIDLNSQQYKNAAWTSLSSDPTNASWLKDAIAKSLGDATKKDVTIPSVEVGKTYIDLGNGIMGQKDIGDRHAQLFEKTLYLPVIQGDPPFNDKRLVIGIVAVKVRHIESDKGLPQRLHVEIVGACLPGMGTHDFPKTGNGDHDKAIIGFQPKVAKLLY
jgi:hypothetical protein